VVETGGLENRFTLTGNGGSNPSPSAIKSIAPSQMLLGNLHAGIHGSSGRDRPLELVLQLQPHPGQVHIIPPLKDLAIFTDKKRRAGELCLL
jgi:hypothetical protein